MEEKDKSDEALTEKKSYTLPTLEPMMSTWTYMAVKLEASPARHSDDESREEVIASVDAEDENVGTSDEE